MLIQPQMFPQRSVFIHGHDARQCSERRGSGFSGGYRLVAFQSAASMRMPLAATQSGEATNVST